MLRIAIVGRPNVGKSALFNRMLRRRMAIVHDQPGVTRDRLSAVVEREGRSYELVDTGGIGMFETKVTPKDIAEAVQLQADVGIEAADLILFVVDGLEGVRPLDLEICTKLRKSGKKVWLLVNKLDTHAHETKVAEFTRLGMQSTYPVSASHGTGMDDLWQDLAREHDRVVKGRAGEESQEAGYAKAPRIVIVGRPNVGKSSLTNRLLGAERVIVSDVPGTTRDPIELPLEYDRKKYVIVDTAGVRAISKIHDNVEMYSRYGTKKAIRRADIILLMHDSQESATRQDREIAGMVLEENKPCIILVNKWDLNETVEVQHELKRGVLEKKHKKRRQSSRSEYEKEMRYRMPFLEYAPILFISALQGYHATQIWKEIARVTKASVTTFTTGVLNRIFNKAQQRVQAPIRQGARLKIYYAIQKTDAPIPTFVLFVNHPKHMADEYLRFLGNEIRKEAALTGCPIHFQLRSRENKIKTGTYSQSSKSRGVKRDLPE